MAVDRDTLEDLVLRLRRMNADVSRLQELIVKETARTPSGEPQAPAVPEPRRETASAAHCPYCGRAMQWNPMLKPTRGGFECERCGEFLDFRRSLPSSTPDRDRRSEPERPRPS